LYVTPERFISESIFQIQNIKLVCIDEAHCISKFSTSSRFSYMILPKFLKNFTRLALTGSIDKQSQDDVEKLLWIKKVVKFGRAFRKNLQVTVSREDDILTFAGKICRSENYKKGSLIFYCNLQYLTDSVSQWLRSKGETCQSYHSGLSDSRRQQVQEDFTSGKVRILVATVSFGMGIDKSNVSSVIHLHLPSSLEQFIQESGRAGRNGDLAKVHILVNDSTLYYQRSLIYSNHINKRHILSFGKILHPNLKRTRDSQESSEFLYIQISQFLQELGVNKETLLEILNFFEKKGLVSNVSISPLNANISFHKTSPEELSKKFAIVSHVLTTGKKLASCRRVYLPELAKKVGLDIRDTVKVLKRLAATGEINAEFMDEGFELTCLSFPSEIELLKLAAETEEFFQGIEEVLRTKIETCFLVFDKVAKDSFQQCQDVFEEISDLIEEYIQGKLVEEMPVIKVDGIKNDVLCVATQFEGVPDSKDITCVLQGINTERTPYSRWKGYYLWSRYRKCRFMDVYQQVTQVLIEGIEEKVSAVESYKEIIEDSD
jgi:ATP-dependent DNA helicase Q4